MVPLSNLVYSTQVPEESFGSVEQGLIFRTHHDVGDIPMAPVGIQQEPLPEGQGEGRDCQEVLVIAHQQRRDRERLRRFLRAFTGERTNKEKMLKYLVGLQRISDGPGSEFFYRNIGNHSSLAVLSVLQVYHGVEMVMKGVPCLINHVLPAFLLGKDI